MLNAECRGCQKLAGNFSLLKKLNTLVLHNSEHDIYVCLSVGLPFSKVAMVRLFWDSQPAVRNVTGHDDDAHRLSSVKYYLMPSDS